MNKFSPETFKNIIKLELNVELKSFLTYYLSLDNFEVRMGSKINFINEVLLYILVI